MVSYSVVFGMHLLYILQVATDIDCGKWSGCRTRCMAVLTVNWSKLPSQRFGLLVVNGRGKWLPSGFANNWGR